MSGLDRAIKLAIEGGYNDNAWDGTENSSKKTDEQMLLDPLFWQALGKALGWEEHDNNQRKLYRLSGANPDYMPKGLYKWHDRAMNFFDLVMRNGDTEKFWSELLNSKD